MRNLVLLMVGGWFLFSAFVAHAQVLDKSGAEKDARELAAMPLPDIRALLAVNPEVVPAPPAAELATLAPVGVPPMEALPPPSGSVSTLNNPSSPACAGDGVTDDSGCIQAAINTGDVLLQHPRVAYVAHGIRLPSGRHIAGVDNLVTLRNPLAGGGPNDSTFVLDHTNGASISNLTFANAGDAIRARYSYAGEFVFQIELRNASSRNVIAGNRFQGTQGDAAIELYSGSLQDANNYNMISGNTFAACGLYGIAITSGSYNTVTNNWLRDCSLGSEMDAGCRQANVGNRYTNNHLELVNGGGWHNLDPAHPSVFLTGGAAAGCHYQNIVANNALGPGVITYPMR